MPLSLGAGPPRPVSFTVRPRSRPKFIVSDDSATSSRAPDAFAEASRHPDAPDEAMALVKRLAKLAEGDNRARVATLLRQHGLAAPAIPRKVDQAIRERLDLPQERLLQVTRLLELTAASLDLATALDAHVAEAWSAMTGEPIGPDSPGGDGELREVASRFASLPRTDPGRRDAEREVAGRMAALGRRIRLLLALPRAFSKRHADAFAPVEIEHLPGVAGKPAKAWTRYRDLWGGPEREHVEDRLGRTFAEILDRLAATVPQVVVPEPAPPEPEPATADEASHVVSPTLPRRRAGPLRMSPQR